MAKILLADGRKTTGDAVDRYMLLREAQDLAMQGRSSTIVVETIDTLAKHYQIDRVFEKVEKLKALGKNTYEIRTKTFDGRLIGTAYRNNNIYKALQSYMPLEDALTLTRSLQEGEEQTQLIIFNREATKHNKINKTM